MRIVAFYTPSYSHIVKNLTASIEKFGYDYTIYEVEDRGCWEKNCAQKPEVIFRAMQEYEDDILYLDADAMILRELPLHELFGDTMMFYLLQWEHEGKKVNELISATIYIPYNLNNLDLVKQWEEHQKEDSMIWDQQTLGEVLNKLKDYKFNTLSAEWNYIEKYHAPFLTLDPIIIQSQASRTMKDV
jgi:hypothetical protein